MTAQTTFNVVSLRRPRPAHSARSVSSRGVTGQNPLREVQIRSE